MKNTAAHRSTWSIILDTVLILAALGFLCAMIAGPLHGQTPPSAPPAATTVTLSADAATVAQVAQAVDPGFFTQARIDQIVSIIVGLVAVSRVILKYFAPASPPPGGAWAKIIAFLNHTGGVITMLCLGLFMGLALTACSTAQVTQFKTDANKAATDVLLAAPSVLSYSAVAVADIGTAVKDITPLATAVQGATASTSPTVAAPAP